MSRPTLQTAYKALLTRNRLTPNPDQLALVDRLDTLQNTLSSTINNHEYTKGIYIYGSVGTGKSRIADLFASTLPTTITKRRIHFHEFMMDIHSRLHVARSQKSFAGDPLLQIGRDVQRESRVLCFDEFQVTDIADAMILKRLFGGFWSNGGVVVSTSNRHPKDLYENGLNRDLFLPFVHELVKRCEVWKMGGERDYRMGGGGGVGDAGRMDVFFNDQGAFERCLKEALAGGVLEEVTIPVMMSRRLDVMGVKKAGELIVSTTFENICQAYLGSMDYHALCKASKTIFISGLRKFKADELDFVRRFITLVDLAYEAKTRIYCLSSVPLLEVFANIVSDQIPVEGQLRENLTREMSVKGEGGSSSSMMTTYIGETEWSATGLAKASLASGGAGETDVRFAVGRAVSRLFEMGSVGYGAID